MNSARVNPNVSYASIASGAFKTKDLSLLPLKRYTFKSPYKQYFSFPFDFMKYILKNPKSSNVLLKLYKTCKYFYSKKQVLIISGKISYNNQDAVYTIETSENHGWPDISKLKVDLWVMNDLTTWNTMPLNLSRIYRSTIKRLFIFRMEMNIKTFKLLASENSIEIFILYCSSIRDANSKNISIDEILPFMPKLKKLKYGNINEKFPLETLKKINSIKFENKIEWIVLYLENVSETFDSKLLFNFFQQNVSFEMCEIYLTCIGENRDVLEMNLKSVEKEMFPMKKRSETFKIVYDAPRGFE